MSFMSLALAGMFFTTSATWEAPYLWIDVHGYFLFMRSLKAQGCCPVFSELRRGPGPLGKEYRERLPLLNLPLLSTASLGGGGGGKVRINVEESVDGKVVSSRKREI